MTTLIAECEDQVLEWAACVNEDKLIICYLKDVKSLLYIHDLSTGDRLHQIPLEIGAVTGVSADKRYSEWFYTFNSTIIPRYVILKNFILYLVNFQLRISHICHYNGAYLLIFLCH